MRRKRGESSGSGAAVLVAIIAGLIILYILFLDPEQREELLETDSDGKRKSNDDDLVTAILLDEDPGTLDRLQDDEFEIDIPAFNLFRSTDAKEIEAYNDFSIRNGWFDKKTVEKTFIIDDLANTNDIVLSFLAKNHKGTLAITLNSELIYENPLETQNVLPVKLRKKYLKKGENTITFSVSPVGIAFFRTNEYNLENVRVIADITDISRQQTRNIFTIEPWKYNNLDKATIKFDPECRQETVGVLDVIINDINIFSGIPDCGILNKYLVPIGTFNAGVNDVVFKTNQGSYIVDQIKIDLELEEITSPLYWFDVSEDLFRNVTADEVDVNLTLLFIDDDEEKLLDINVNGRMTRVDQEEPVYNRRLNSWIEEGRNYIKLIPKKNKVDIVNILIKSTEIEDDDD